LYGRKFGSPFDSKSRKFALFIRLDCGLFKSSEKKVLGVGDQVLEEYGAVSAPVVEQMAKGVLALTSSDYSLAVTGIAGPDGGTNDKPVGTIWAAIANQTDRPDIWSFHVLGGRQEIIDQTVEIILSRFWSCLNQSLR
jgi:PncC family amidohydrolase